MGTRTETVAIMREKTTTLTTSTSPRKRSSFFVFFGIFRCFNIYKRENGDSAKITQKSLETSCLVRRALGQQQYCLVESKHLV